MQRSVSNPNVGAQHPLVRLLLEHILSQHFRQVDFYLRALLQHCLCVVKLRASSRATVVRNPSGGILTPVMSELPREGRAFNEPHFSNSGVNYFGPFLVSVKPFFEKR